MAYTDLLKGRASVTGQIYLVTTVTSGRERLFTNLCYGRIVVRALHCETTAARAATLAYVVMPDHLHWLVQLNAGGDLSDVVKRVKARSAFQINRTRESSRAVWQPKFHDHALRREEDLQAVARYVVRNPLRAGLVRRINDYPLWDAVWV